MKSQSRVSDSSKTLPGDYLHIDMQALDGTLEGTGEDGHSQMGDIRKMAHKLQESPKDVAKPSEHYLQQENPETIKGYRKLPLDVQNMVKTLAKSRKQRSD